MATLHPSVRFMFDLRKAEQLSLFGGGRSAGPTKQVHVKPHTRMTSHGIEQVAAHDRMTHVAAPHAPMQEPTPKRPLRDAQGGPLTLYQGNDASSMHTSSDGGSEHGIYLTPSRSYAQQYGRNVHRTWAKLANPKVVENKGEISSGNLTAADVQRLQAQGHDGIIVKRSGDPDDKASEIVVFDASSLIRHGDANAYRQARDEADDHDEQANADEQPNTDARYSDKLPAPMNGAPDKATPVKTIGPFNFPPFGMISARAKWVDSRRSQADHLQSRTTVYWHDAYGDPQAATFDPMAGRHGEWSPETRGGPAVPPELVTWALHRLGVRPLLDPDPEIDNGPGDFLAYSYINRHMSTDDEMIEALKQLRG